MKQEELLDAIGEVNDIVIEDAGKQSGIRSRRKQWLRAVACICLAALLGTAAVYKIDHKYPVERVPVVSSGTETSAEIAVIPRWEEMTTPQRYSYAQFQGRDYTYYGSPTEIPEEAIGAYLGTAQTEGWDEYTQTRYEAEMEVYAFAGYTEQYAVAVHMPGEEEYWAYIDYDYAPATLGQLVDDLNLQENLTMHHVSYDYRSPILDRYVYVRFTGLKEDRVWDWLLERRETENAMEDLWLISEMTIGIDVKYLHQNIALSVSEDGWLWTNILSNTNAFYIGEAAVEDFMNYVFTECEGHEIVYVPSNEAGMPE